MGVNKQIIVGNLGKDPDVRTFQDGSKACRFPVAVTEKGYQRRDGTQVPEHTEWFNIYIKGAKVDVAQQYLHKGDKVYIEGKTFTGEYTDQQGVKKTYTEVQCDVLELLTPKAQTQQQQYQQQGASWQPAAPQYAPQTAAQGPQYQPAAQAPQYQPAPQQAPQAAPVPQAAPQQMGVFGQPAQQVPYDERPF